MLKTFLISIFLFVLLVPNYQAQGKKTAILTTIGSLGEFSEIETITTFTSLQKSLSIYYALSFQKAFEDTLVDDFKEMGYEECTEDPCFAMIQQILQVDNLFLFKTTREDTFKQLSLDWEDLDSQRFVSTAFCEECTIRQLKSPVEGLVIKLISDDKKSIIGTKFIEKPKETRLPLEEQLQKSTSRTETENVPESFLNSKGDSYPDKNMQYIAVSVTVVSALMSYKSAQSYNELSAKNSALSTKYLNSNSSSEQASYKSEYDRNAREMKSYKSNSQTWDLMTLTGLGWNAYLIMNDNEEITSSNYNNYYSNYIPRFAFKKILSGPQTILSWNMNF